MSHDYMARKKIFYSQIYKYIIYGFFKLGEIWIENISFKVVKYLILYTWSSWPKFFWKMFPSKNFLVYIPRKKTLSKNSIGQNS